MSNNSHHESTWQPRTSDDETETGFGLVNESAAEDRMARTETRSLPPGYLVNQANQKIERQLQAVCRQYEITSVSGARLRVLNNFKIVLLLDDSGSMSTPVDEGNRTRWDELRMIVKIVLEISTIFDTNGVDLYFLNRPSVLHVKDPRSVDRVFENPPGGFTPLAGALRYIFQELPAARRGNDKKLFVFIATDGEPTDEEGNPNFEEFEHVMHDERNPLTTHVMFLICTDEPKVVDYLSKWDRTLENVAVTGDFRTERAKIRRKHEPDFQFSMGDYVVKALIGAVDRDTDRSNDCDQQDEDVNA